MSFSPKEEIDHDGFVLLPLHISVIENAFYLSQYLKHTLTSNVF